MAVPNTGSSGFSALGTGTYSIWIQDFNAGTFTYGFDFALTPTPEPNSLCAFGSHLHRWFRRSPASTAVVATA